MSGILCAGDLYFNRKVNGVYAGLLYLFDAKKFAITESAEDKDRISRGRDTFGQLGNTVKIKKPAELEISGDDISSMVLALATMGTVAAATQNSGTVTTATVGLKKDVWVQLPHAYLEDAGVVLTNNAASTTYVEGTDYKVLRRLGWVMALTTDAAANNNKLSYAYAAATGDIITGGDNPDIRGQFVLDGKNLATQRDLIVTVDEGIVAPTEALDFTSGEYIAVNLKGKMVTLPGKTRPYTIEYR